MATVPCARVEYRVRHTLPRAGGYSGINVFRASLTHCQLKRPGKIK